METLVLPAEMTAEIVAHTRAGLPNEVCGIISGANGAAVALYRGRNTSPTPRVAYDVDVETLARQIEFEESGLMLAAIYHSHPMGPETPSQTDLARAYYPESIYIICSLADPARPVVRGFRLADGRSQEVQLI